MNRGTVASLCALASLACDADPGPSASLLPAAGPPGVRLFVTTPVIGDRMRVYLDGAPPNATVAFVVGQYGGTTCPPVLGGACLQASNPILLALRAADSSGTVDFEVDVPDGLRQGSRQTFQAAVLTGSVSPVSNAIPMALSRDIEVFGTWTTSRSTEFRVDNRTWTSHIGFVSTTQDVVRFDNSRRRALLLARPGSPQPGTYSTVQWTTLGTDTWTCVLTEGQATARAAWDVPTSGVVPSAANPPCSPLGAPWTPWDPMRMFLEGSWFDDTGGFVTLTSTTWTSPAGTWHIRSYDNRGQWVIARNDDNNATFPGLWSRFDWTLVGPDAWVCQSTADAATAADALTAPPADPSDPANGGCGPGLPWTRLSQ